MGQTLVIGIPRNFPGRGRNQVVWQQRIPVYCKDFYGSITGREEDPVRELLFTESQEKLHQTFRIGQGRTFEISGRAARKPAYAKVVVEDCHGDAVLTEITGNPEPLKVTAEDHSTTLFVSQPFFHRMQPFFVFSAVIINTAIELRKMVNWQNGKDKTNESFCLRQLRTRADRDNIYHRTPGRPDRVYGSPSAEGSRLFMPGRAGI
jgi:hypothetical protein